MDRYFDAFVYVANWGTRRLMFRIPRNFFDVEGVSAYCDEDSGLSFKAGKAHVVLEFRSEDEEDGDWVEGEPWMPDLISLRADLMRGDTRALYLGWLATLESDNRDEDEDEEQEEPPVPPGLKKLSAPLKALAEFLRVDNVLIEAAADRSVGEPPSEPSRDVLERWVKGLPVADKNDYLVRFLAEDGDLFLRAEIAKRFRDEAMPKPKRAASEAKPRTVKQLFAARDALIEGQDHQAAQAKARRDRKEAEERARYLDGLALRERAAWEEVDSLIESKQQKEYDEAVSLLVDLQDQADRSGRSADVTARIRELRQRHRTKSSLIRRLNEQGLGR